MSDAATIEYSADAKKLGDQIADLTLKQAKELSDYLENVHGIKPAAGGGMMMAMPMGGAGGGEAAKVEQTEFNVILTGFGDKKLNVVKVVKNLTGATLMDAKKLVESAPATIKEKVSKEEAQKLKAELEEAGASIEVK